MLRTAVVILVAVCGFAWGCAMDVRKDGTAAAGWAIAIHGGAGAIQRNESKELEAAYRASLRKVLQEGKVRLSSGESAIDVCEALVRMMEDDELFNAGKGATLTETGEVELDAAIMDGGTGRESGARAGAVAGVKTVKNPISLARRVMESTPHVMLIGDGAEEFATAVGVERVPNASFITDRRRSQLERELLKRKKAERRDSSDARYGTVGVVTIDCSGRLAAATSTGGMTGKMRGRVGDAPIIGAGTFANQVVAISCTGTGEQFIRHAVASGVAARMSLLGEDVKRASDHFIFTVLKPQDGGMIAVDARGNIAMPFSSAGMYRGAANSEGRFEVRIWEE